MFSILSLVFYVALIIDQITKLRFIGYIRVMFHNFFSGNYFYFKLTGIHILYIILLPQFEK